MHRQNNEESMTLSWTWDRPWRNIKIFKDSILVGTIEDFKPATINKIFQDKITIEKQGVIGQFIYFVDPVDNKAYCEYNFGKIESKTRTCEFIDGILYEVSKVNSKNSYKKLVQLNVKRKFFEYWKNSGEIIVFDSDKIGIDIFSIFYHYNATRVDDAS